MNDNVNNWYILLIIMEVQFTTFDYNSVKIKGFNLLVLGFNYYISGIEDSEFYKWEIIMLINESGDMKVERGMRD